MAQQVLSEDEILIAAICGSLRSTSYTRMALEIALQGAQESGVHTQMINLRDYQLVFTDGEKASVNIAIDGDIPTGCQYISVDIAGHRNVGAGQDGIIINVLA